MAVNFETIRVSTQGRTDVIDLTSRVQALVDKAPFQDGAAFVFVTGSTAGVSTIEYEPGLVQDIKTAFERVAPESADYKHHERWGDDNGHSHVRACMLGPSLSVPFRGRKLLLGRWQQIVLIDFDTSPRDREIVVELIGG